MSLNEMSSLAGADQLRNIALLKRLLASVLLIGYQVYLIVQYLNELSQFNTKV